ncbi:MAG: S-layer homology domain-containing protein [Oscillospiraceae bacterium]|nr:S-layer homology domain-containing protein [Oscillospiraceae bacterium]
MKHILHRLAAAVGALALCLTSARALSVEDARALLEDNYVDKLPAAAYEAATLDELFAAIGDPYTYYMSATDYEEFTAAVESETSVTGIGAGVEYTADGILITSILSGGGAEQSGLRPGDLIIAIDGVDCVPASTDHRALIIGEEGTHVTLTVRRPDGATSDYRIERRTVTLHNTTVTFEDGVATIDCDSFGLQTAQYFYDGLEQYDGEASLWVVDLRGNTGGYADSAVGALGAFTGFGPKLYYRLNDGNYFYRIYLAEQMTEKPAIVLVNGYSASASEILSGGIRAEDAGIVVGTRTYGKGTAQIVADENSYPDLFSGDSLKITAYRFYCSDGNTTDRIGVLPTLLVGSDYAADVASLLSAEQPARGEYLTLELNGNTFYLDPAAAKSAGRGDALSELLSALPPDASVARVTSSGADVMTPAGALAKYGDPAQSRGFADVADSAYASEINTLATYRILGGDGKGHFFPHRTLTRAELATMLAQALNVTNGGASTFSDVSDGSWYCGGVNAIASLGFMRGFGDGRFVPNAALTQEQLIAVMGRLVRVLNFHADDFALALDGEALAENELFARLPAWARTEASVLTQYDGNMLYADLAGVDPQAPVTREQAAATLYNILKTLDILAY